MCRASMAEPFESSQCVETIIIKNSYVLICVCIWESYNDGTGEWFEIYAINQV